MFSAGVWLLLPLCCWLLADGSILPPSGLWSCRVELGLYIPAAGRATCHWLLHGQGIKVGGDASPRASPGSLCHPGNFSQAGCV